MSITLNSYAAGDTNYVAKLNSDMTQIQAAVNAQEGQITANIGTTGGGGAGIANEIWRDSGIVGASSYKMTLNSDTGLSFTSGSIWHFATQNLGQQANNLLLQFAGKAADTYYINADTAGILTISTVAAAVPVFTVDFGAPSFTVLSQGQPYLFDGGDYRDVLSDSDTFGSVVNLADRLSKIEATLNLDAQFADFKKYCCRMKILFDQCDHQLFTIDKETFNTSFPKIMDNLIMAFVKDVPKPEKAARRK